MRQLRTQTVEGYWVTPCIYCGVVANTRDHFVPRAYRELFTNWRRENRWAKAPDTVPCCSECNNIANARVFSTIAAKRAYIQERLKKKYADLLAAPLWDEESLSQLGWSLRTSVDKAQFKKITLLLRLSWPYETEIEAFHLAQQS